MIDFSPLDGGVRGRCLPVSGLGAEVRGGGLAELRVNTVGSPDDKYTRTTQVCSTSPFVCNLLALLHRDVRVAR